MDPGSVYDGPFPELTSRRLRLRELRPDDAPAVFELFADHEVTRWYDLETFTEPEQAEQLIDRWRQRVAGRIGLRWALELGAAPGGLIGTCGYNLWWAPEGRGVLGFDLARRHWRQGLMAEAVGAVLDFGFERMGLQRVEALAFVGNDASTGLLDSLGFQHEGVLRDYQRLHGRLADMHIYSLLRRERLAP